MFERPLLLWLLLATPLVALPALLAVRRGRVAAGLVAAALRVLAFAALVFALSGFGIPTRTASRQVETVALIDQSRWIAPDQQTMDAHQRFASWHVPAVPGSACSAGLRARRADALPDGRSASALNAGDFGRSRRHRYR